MKINILCLGISHHTAPVRQRQRLSKPAEAILETLKSFARAREAGGKALPELAILSTCNRLEFYACAVNDAADSSEKSFKVLRDIFTAFTGLPLTDVELFLFHLTNATAIQHLVEVACGLDSLVLGESQILGQVAEAHEMALNAGSAGLYLSSLFRAAIHAGKRVQTETNISRNGSNLSAAAVALAVQLVGDLAESQVVVIGAGEMADLALESLHKRGARQITITNRTFENAQVLGEKWNLPALPFSQLPGLIAAADIIFALTSARRPLLDQQGIARAAASRPQRPLVLIDLGVPPNIAVEVKKLPGVNLVDLDDLQISLEQSGVRPEDEVLRARSIADVETLAYENWLTTLPVISQLHKKAEAIRQREVERTLRRLPNPDPQINELFQLFSQSLVKKLLHDPTMHLRNDSNPNLKQYSEALEVLFDLPVEDRKDQDGKDLRP